MDYEFRLALVDDASKKIGGIRRGIGGTLDAVEGIQKGFTQLPKPIGAVGDAVQKTQRKTKGLLNEIVSMNRLLRRTTTLFGAAFSIGHVSQFAGEVIQTEQALANMFGLTDNELKKATSQATRISSVFGTDVNETIQTANALAKQFGISASESFDLIQTGLEKGISKDVLGNIQEFAPAFQKAGIEAEGLLGLLAQGQRAGVGDELVGAYAEAIDRLGSLDGEGTIDALGLIGLSPNKLKKALDSGELEVGQLVQMVTSKIQQLGPNSVEARKALEGVFGSSAQSIQNNIGLLAEVPPAIGAIQDRTTQAAKSQQFLLTAWADFKIFVSENIIPVLVDVIGWVRENSESLIFWAGWGLRIVGVFGSIWAAAKLIMGIRGMVMTVVGAYQLLTSVLNFAKVAQFALNAVMLANPFGLIVVGIAAVGAAVWGVVSYWEDIKNFLWNVSEALLMFNPLSWMAEAIDWLFPGFSNALDDWYNNITGVFGSAFDWIESNFLGPLGDAWDWFTGWFSTAEEKIRGLRIETGALSLDELDTALGAGVDSLAQAMEAAGIEMNQDQGDSLGRFAGAKTSAANLGISKGVAQVQADTTAKNISINITKLVETLEVNTTTLNESTTKIKEEIIKVLLSAVNDANVSTG